jgi:Glycosyl transferase family 64 domain
MRRHRLYSPEDDETEHRHSNESSKLNLKEEEEDNDPKGRPHHHHHQYSIGLLPSFLKRRLVAARRTHPPSSNTNKLTTGSKRCGQAWILLRLLLASLFLFVALALTLIVWLVLFPQDAPQNTHIEIPLFLRNVGNNNNNNNNKGPAANAAGTDRSVLDDIKVSVVVMNHNRPRLLQQSRLLPTLLAHPNVDEIILAHSNPATQFDYYKDYFHDYYYYHADNPSTGYNHNKNKNIVKKATNNKIVNINATQANVEMGLSLRFYYCAHQARHDYVIIVDDDQEMTLDAISRLILEFVVSTSAPAKNGINNNNNSNNNGTLQHGDGDDRDGKARYYPHNPHRIVGRYGRVYHEASTWWSWYHTGNHGYDTRTYTGRVEVVLTKFLMLHRTTCRAFFDYQHLVYNDLIVPQSQRQPPLWNGEDIFMSLVANHLYQKHQLQQQQLQQQQLQNDNIILYNNYATSALNVWEAPAVEEHDTEMIVSTTGPGNSRTGISGNLDRNMLFWNVGWAEYWQIKARARAHIHYRGLLWFTARQRLAEQLLVTPPQEEKGKEGSS